ncbi:diguanylate cyclase [Stappia sp. 28M-7]|uniref:diguanylate cyclase n=1 Tax=Stappia sp. 28M-7 TaxID=2762596 RepID=UPI00163C615F|nr:diguanylate cyclase [Stappia sp. 28M-7]MBC2860277.1 diguanylate cyclase [Stappia sp. 28M-7]
MKISTITNLAYAVTLLLTALSGIAFIVSDRMAAAERRSVEVHMALNDLGAQLEVDAELRTDEARLYVMRDDPAHLAVFERVNEEEHRFEALARHAGSLGASGEELELLERIAATVDRLEEIETTAVETYRSGNVQAARDALFGDEHYSQHVRLVGDVERFRTMVDQRTGLELQRAQIWADWLGMIARVLLALTAVVFLAVLYFVLRRRVSVPLTQMTGIVKRLATQDFAVEVPHDGRSDEIGELTSAIRVFRENGLERERLDAERRRDLKMKDLILQMMHRMQACQRVPEIAEVVGRFSPQIFPELGGALFVRNEANTELSRLGAWQLPDEMAANFSPEECWGLRRGQPHHSTSKHDDVECRHLAKASDSILCIPLSAHGDTLGLLSFADVSGNPGTIREYQAYLGMIGENVALAVANLQLRERLTRLAVRDPLTGLLNRRSLDEALACWAREEGEPELTCFVIDIDHFKRFNDEFGHDAGDTVLQTVGGILTDIVSDRGVCYRFGGEEFAVLLPKVSKEEAYRIAEHIRTRMATLTLSHAGRILGTITVSIGMADNRGGKSVDTVRSRADAALFAAKASGRNQTLGDESVALPAGEA